MTLFLLTFCGPLHSLDDEQVVLHSNEWDQDKTTDLADTDTTDTSTIINTPNNYTTTSINTTISTTTTEELTTQTCKTLVAYEP